MRASDGKPTRRKAAWIWWQRIGATLVTAFALGIAAYAVKVADDANDTADRAAKAAESASTVAQAQVIALRNEARDRLDQACTRDERNQKRDVETLRRTYDYLVREQREGRSLASGINRAVLIGLPRTEADAREDDALPACDKPGVGLPEPDPVLPKRPKSLPPG